MPWIRVLAPVGAASAVSLLGFILLQSVSPLPPDVRRAMGSVLSQGRNLAPESDVMLVVPLAWAASAFVLSVLCTGTIVVAAYGIRKTLLSFGARLASLLVVLILAATTLVAYLGPVHAKVTLLDHLLEILTGSKGRIERMTFTYGEPPQKEQGTALHRAAAAAGEDIKFYQRRV